MKNFLCCFFVEGDFGVCSLGLFYHFLVHPDVPKGHLDFLVKAFL